jgi:predicted aspartyl protease
MARYCLGFLVFFAWAVPASYGLHCDIVAAHTPSDAESAYLHADYEKAASLYQAQLQQHPNDPEAVVGLVRVLLRQQKVESAVDVAKKGLSSDPKSAPMMVALAEAEYRAGAPWQSAALGGEAYKTDPCYARVYLLMGRLARLDSLYATAANDFRTAHTLDPHDPTIRSMWIGTLPSTQRVTEVEAYLASPTGDDAEDLQRLTKYLERLKKNIATPRQPCRLSSAATSTEISFVPVTEGMNKFRGFGLGVKINGQDWRLQIDTGASGVFVDRTVAKSAGLEPVTTGKMSGIGDGGAKNGYTAYAKSIQIGSLEFHDCNVYVLDSQSVVGLNGLIGTDVFSNFLVTLDYPMRKLALSPLPARPQQPVAAPSLATGEAGEDEGGSASTATTTAGAPSPTPHGPYDRYVAPEMQDYTRLYRVGHMLLMPTSVNKSIQRLFVLDTGAFTTSISPETARQVTKVYREDRLHISGVSGGVNQAYTANDVTLNFGGIEQPGHNVVAFDTSSVSRDIGLDISGFIGATTLDQLTTHIDYRDGLVKFDYDPKRGYRPLQ